MPAGWIIRPAFQYGFGTDAPLQAHHPSGDGGRISAERLRQRSQQGGLGQQRITQQSCGFQRFNAGGSPVGERDKQVFPLPLLRPVAIQQCAADGQCRVDVRRPVAQTSQGIISGAQSGQGPGKQLPLCWLNPVGGLCLAGLTHPSSSAWPARPPAGQMQRSTVLVGGRLEIGGHRERSGMGGIGIQQAQAEGWFLAGQLLHGLRSGRGRREPFQNLAP